MSMERAAIAVKMGSERSFAIVFAVVFLAVALYPLLGSGGARWWAVAVSGLLLAVGFVRPALLRWPNRVWFHFGMLLGRIVAPLVMGLVYVAAVVTTGLIVRMVGKDPLSRQLDGERDSYWIPRKVPPQPFRNQF